MSIECNPFKVEMTWQEHQTEICFKLIPTSGVAFLASGSSFTLTSHFLHILDNLKRLSDFKHSYLSHIATKNQQQYGPVSDVVMNSNKMTGP